MSVSGISDRMGVTLTFRSLCGLGPFLRRGLTFNFNNFRGFRLNKYFMGSMIKLWIFKGRGRDGHHSQLGSVAKKERMCATPVI